jgi:hypothetical protein
MDVLNAIAVVNPKQVHQTVLSQYCPSRELNWCKLAKERTKPMRLFRNSLNFIGSIELLIICIYQNKVRKKPLNHFPGARLVKQ